MTIILITILAVILVLALVFWLEHLYLEAKQQAELDLILRSHRSYWASHASMRDSLLWGTGRPRVRAGVASSGRKHWCIHSEPSTGKFEVHHQHHI